MIGIVIVTHGRLAQEFIAAAEHVVGKQQAIRAVCIEPEGNAEQCRAEILAAIDAVEQGKGVVILTDMFGGTPSNLAISVMKGDGIEVVAGVNLPMLIKLVSIRQSVPLAEAVLMAQESGRKYINVASNLLSRESLSKASGE